MSIFTTDKLLNKINPLFGAEELFLYILVEPNFDRNRSTN